MDKSGAKTGITLTLAPVQVTLKQQTSHTAIATTRLNYPMGISDTLFEANTDLKKGYIWYFVTNDETFQYDESIKKEVREIITKIENLNRNLDTPPGYVPEKIEEWFPPEEDQN